METSTQLPNIPKGWIEIGAVLGGLSDEQALDIAHHVADSMGPVGLADGTTVTMREASMGNYSVTHDGWPKSRTYETVAVSGFLAMAIVRFAGDLETR